MKKKTSGTNSTLSESEVFKLVQELDIHQIELQAQGEEFKQALELLKESEEKYRLLHENAGIGIGHYKPDGTIISFNQLAAKNMDGLPEDFEGKSIYAIFPRTEAEFYHDRIFNALSADHPVVYEDMVSLPSGNKYFMSTFTKIEGLNNQVMGVQVISQEITKRRKVEDDLRESERKLRQLFKNMTSGFAFHEIILNAEGKPCDYRFLEINPAFEKLTGLQSINLIGKTALTVLPNTEPHWIETYGKVALTGKAINFESYSSELGKYFQVNAYSPEPGKFVTIILDITERKQNVELLQESEIKYRSLVETAQELVWICDGCGSFTYLNPSWEKTHGYTLDEMLGKNFSEFQRPEVFERDIIEFTKHLEGASVKEYETTHIAKNGREITLLFNAIPLVNLEGKIIGTQGTAIDITDRKNSEAELCKSNEIHKQLLQHMTEIRENERALISREIHDQLGQSLTALKLDINWLQSKMNNTPEIKEKLAGMVDIVTSTIKDVQRISAELRPGILDDLGLAAAIEWYAEEFEKRSNLMVKLDLDEVQVPNEQANLALFRVMQESLTNIIRHAKAKSVQISLHEMNEHIVLDIEDDGIGMSVEKLNSNQSLGLLGMHDRIKQVGGTIDILCGSDAGTKIRICISCHPILPELSKNQRL